MADVPMNGGSGNLPAPRGGETRLELLMALELFGFRLDADGGVRARAATRSCPSASATSRSAS